MSNQVKDISFRKEREEVGFEIIKLDYFFKKLANEKNELPHRIKFYIILFITDGKGTHQIDFQSYNYQKGSVLFIGKDQIHIWSENADINGYLLLFTEDFLSHNQIFLFYFLIY